MKNALIFKLKKKELKNPILLFEKKSLNQLVYLIKELFVFFIVNM